MMLYYFLLFVGSWSHCHDQKIGSLTSKRCYTFVDDYVSWAAANASCSDMDAELVIIRDNATQEYLEQTMEEIGWTTEMLIGHGLGLELKVMDNFTWVSGADVGEESFVSLIHSV